MIPLKYLYTHLCLSVHFYWQTNLFLLKIMAKFVISELLNIFKGSYTAVLPNELIYRILNYNHTNQHLKIQNDIYDLKNKNVYIVGTGKAVQSMAKTVESILGPKTKGGIISIPVGSLKGSENTNLIYCEGAENNLPDIHSETTARKVKDLVTQLGQDDFLIVLISGGGSALLSLPRNPVTLAEKTDLIKTLANAGADIKELNIVRTKLSDLKGGKLAMYAQPAQVVSLILSDIVGDPLDLIASGPTTEIDKESLATSTVKEILCKYKIINLPKSIEKILTQNQEADTQTFPHGNVKNYLIGSNKISMIAASNTAKQYCFKPIKISNTVMGDVKDIAKKYFLMTELFCYWLNNVTTAEEIKKLLQTKLNLELNDDFELDMDKDDETKNICLILGGETTVTVTGNGKGGRNQQLALEFSVLLDKEKSTFDNFDVYFLSAGTDGIDGPTDAAGGIGYIDLVLDAKQENLNVENYLITNDSYNFYKQLRNGSFHVVTGHTGTNVMDTHLILIKAK